jgi:amino acid adenylation domain-containing protein
LSKNIKDLPNGAANKRVGKGAFKCLGDLLAHYGRLAPGRKAILAPGRDAVTYGALLARTNDVVRELRSLGVGRSDRIAVVLPGGPETAVATVAVATGAVCVPLNPDFTAHEWQRYFGDLQITALLTRADMNSASRGAAHTLGVPVIDLFPRSSEGPGAFSLVGSAKRRSAVGGFAIGSDDAFILLTSGTTLQPKMVPLTHASVCLSAHNAGASLGLGPRDRLLNVLPLFHAHGLISGLLTALAAGSSVVCTPGFDAAAFFGWLTEFRPTWYTAVPPIHRAVLSAARRRTPRVKRSSLRVIRSASSSLPRDVMGELEALFGVPVVETYGMTEAASQIAANPLRRRKPGSVGRPAGAEIAIMDARGRRLSAGRHGEIALQGPTITRGYHNDVAATKGAFRNGWFRTGDLGYFDEDGYLFIVGRIKDVINRGGQKVAPAEVEEALLDHPDVLEAAAFPISHRRLGEDVGAAVVLRPDAKLSASRLRDFARERLAKFKVPGLIRIVPEIPKVAGGKIRRAGLAAALSVAPPIARGERGTLALPRSRLEWHLATTWADLLELDQIGVDEDVFALGADSLTVMQMLSRLRARFRADLSFQDVFDAPTVEALAARLESSKRNPAELSLRLRDAPADVPFIHLSLQQQRFYILSRLDPTGYDTQVIQVARLSGALDVDALEASIARICKRHEVLRSTFLERLGDPVQMVGRVRPRLEVLDPGPCPQSGRAAAIERQAQELLHQSFDIEQGPLLRVQLLRLDKDDHALVVKLHHLVTDGWSQRLFWEELETFYAASVSGGTAGAPEVPVQYRHFAEWQRTWLRTQAAAEQLSYWRTQLRGLTELPLRTDRPRPEERTGHGRRHPVKLSRGLSRGIKSLSSAHRVTPFMTLLAAFQCLLHRYTGHEDIAVGSLIAGRNRIQIERLVGMFTNTIVLRTDLSGDPSFSEVLRRVRQVTLQAYRNQDLPLEEILRTLQVSRSMDRNTLFQVMFILQNASPRVPSLPGLSVHFVEVDPGIARFDLTLELMEDDERLRGWLEYSTDLFESATITRMAAHLRTFLEAIVASPDERISRLSLLPTRERAQLLIDWNDTRVSFGRLGTFCERFVRQAERTPDAIAVSAGQVRLSYRELARRSSAIAARLAAEGVGPDVVVILLAERSVSFLAAIIAVQWAGGAFLPLDPTWPTARLAEIIQHSGTPLVLADKQSAAALDKALSEMPVRARPQVFSLEDLAQARHQVSVRPVRPGPESLAYVIYTSGSTGISKGAMVEQRGLVNLLHSLVRELQLSSLDVIAQTAPQSFVIAVWQFLTPLMVGARVHIFADEEVRDPVLLVQRIEREGVTVLQIVPALLRAILERVPSVPSSRALSHLRWLNSTGEALAPDLCRGWFRYYPDVPLINAYGSTECSDDVARHVVRAPPPLFLSSMPIGRPISNIRLYVLDAHLQPVPIGVAGELYVGGVGVGRGYLNNPEQTRRNFLPDPFSKRRAARLYKTGDLARWCADGTLEFIGRLDNQVKIRGCRIDLKYIEHVLIEHPAVQSATVLLRDDVEGEPRLVAYVVDAGRQEPGINELRDLLKSRLPEYMIPAGFIFLERMPLTAHGKVNRSALMKIRQPLRVTNDTFVAPRDSTEKALVDIWAELLGVGDISVSSNFFDLGGHSLLAGQVLARVADTLGVSLPIKALFEAPTIEALARRVDRARGTQSNEPTLQIVRLEADGPQLVSISQEHVLRIEREFPGLPQFNLPFAYRLEGPLNVAALKRGLAEVVRRHDSLRAKFAWVDERPVALITPAADVNSPLIVEDLTFRVPTRNKRAKTLLLKKAELELEREAWTPFEMTRAPLFRTRLLRLGADDHVLLLILHHVIVDGWSIGVFMEEVSKFYGALLAGRQAKLPAPAFQFSDFARWQRSWSTTPLAAQQFAYWKEQLRDASPVFPMDCEPVGARLGSRVAHEPVHLPNDLVERLSALSRSQGATLFMTLLAAFKTLLLVRSGRNDICVATIMANRSQLGTERVIGPLDNTTVIRTRIEPDLSFQEALSRVRESVLDSYVSQELPFDVLAPQLAEEFGATLTSLTQVFFALQNPFRHPLELSNVLVRSFGNIYREGQPVLPIDRTWLTMMLKETPSGIIGSCIYKDDRFEPKVIRRWIADYTTILTIAVAKPETPLGQLADPLTTTSG